MSRRILVIDTTDHGESSILKLLVDIRTGVPSPMLSNFIEFDPCKYNNCLYTFVYVDTANKVPLDMIERNRLYDYFRNEFHLILFVTKNDQCNPVFYKSLCFIDEILLRKKVPVICLVDDCDNTNIYNYIQMYPNELINIKSERNERIVTQRIWEFIEKNVQTSNIERNRVDHVNKKPDTMQYIRSMDSSNQNKQLDHRYNDFSSDEWKFNVVPGMFNENNTSIENIIQRCQHYKAYDYDYNCVLLTTGSLNPIHRSHIKNLELVKSYLKQSQPHWNVLAGYLSPTHDDYVRGKLGKATIPSRARCDLCELAIKDHELETHGPSWLNVSRAECEYRQGFVDFGPTTAALCQYLNSLLVVSRKYLKKPIYVIYVCGLDHFNKCSDVRRLAQEKYIKCAVIYRKNNDEQKISTLDSSSNIIYVPLNNERSDIIDISSTEIRRCWKNQPDQLTQLTYDSVVKRLKQMNFHF